MLKKKRRLKLHLKCSHCEYKFEKQLGLSVHILCKHTKMEQASNSEAAGNFHTRNPSTTFVTKKSVDNKKPTNAAGNVVKVIAIEDD